MKDINNSMRRAGAVSNADIGAVLPASHTAPVIEPAYAGTTTSDATLNTALSVSIKYAEDDVGPETADLISGQYTDDSQPTLRGIGTPNGIVKIYTEKGLLGSVQVNEKGEWSFTPEIALPPGVHRFRPDITHPDSEQSLPGPWFELGITEPALLTPEIMDVRDNEGTSSWLKNGATTDDATPTFTGYVDAPGMTIVVRDNGNIIGYVEVEDYGDWTYTPQPALGSGSHSLTFEIVDSQGNVHASEPFVLQVTPSTIAKILYADDNVGNVTDTLFSGARTDDTTPTLHGTGTPDTTINIYYRGSYYLGSVKTDANGEWSFTIPEFSAGSYDFTAREVGANGQLQPAGPKFTLDIVPPLLFTAPTVSAIYDDVGMPKYLNNGSITDDTTPRFTGRGMPNSKIDVRDNGVKIAGVQVDRNGNWSWTPNPALQPGNHRFNFVTPGENGEEYVSKDANLQIITQVPGRILSAEDNVGTVTDTLSNGARTDDATPTLQGKGTPGGIVTLYDGRYALGSAKIDDNGDWHFTPSAALAAGTHSFQAVVTGPDGTTLPASPPFVLTIAPPIPYTAPTLTNIYDDVGVPKYLSNGSITDDTTPRFTGRGMPNSKIDVRDNGVKIAEVQVDRNGNWSWTPNPALQPGNHSFNFVTPGENGQAFSSPDFNVQISNQPPGRILSAEDNVGAITDTLTNGARTDDTTPTLQGRGTAGGTVMIYDSHRLLGSAKIDANGEWSFTPNSPLSTGHHSFTALVINPDGYKHQFGPAFDLIIAAPIPFQTPVIESIHDGEGRQGKVAPGGVSDDTTPTLHGTGTPGATVIIRDLSTGQSTDVQVDLEGYWSWRPVASLSEGEHIFTVIGIDENGKEHSDENNLYPVNIVHPTDNGITSATDDVGDTATLQAGAQTDDARPTLHGFGVPYGDVWIYDDGRLLGSAIIGRDGKWSFTPEQPLAEGIHHFSAMSTNPYNDARTPASPTFELEIVPVVAKPENTTAGISDPALFTLHSLLQDANDLLFVEPEPEIRATQPAEPTAFVPTPALQAQDWEALLNHD